MKDRTPLDWSASMDRQVAPNAERRTLEDYHDLLRMAYQQASTSTSQTTQVGAFVVPYGEPFGEPFGVGWCNWKFGGQWFHAEVTALSNFRDFDKDSPVELITTWGPCLECAKTFVLDGRVHAVHRHNPLGRIHPKWEESIRQGTELLKAAGILIVDYPECDHPPYLFNGVLQHGTSRTT